MTTRIGLFAKHWTPGKTKTRLAESIGEIAAADCSREFLTTTLCRLEAVEGDHQLAYSPITHRAEFEGLLNNLSTDWKLVPQVEGDLGKRMHSFFDSAFEQGAEIAVLLGSDSPDFPIDGLMKGIDWLQSKPLNERGLFLGPSNDGGYWSVGMRQNVAPIFTEMPWSEATLMDSTLDRLKEEGWSQGADYLLIDTWYDVDNRNDLELLNRRLLDQMPQDGALMKLLRYIETII